VRSEFERTQRPAPTRGCGDESIEGRPGAKPQAGDIGRNDIDQQRLVGRPQACIGKQLLGQRIEPDAHAPKTLTQLGLANSPNADSREEAHVDGNAVLGFVRASA
jgi:hypothetical protein